MVNSHSHKQDEAIIGVIVALPEELATLTPNKLARGECFALNNRILVTYAGIGPINANMAATLLIDRGVNALISWGCAAGLDPHLNPGDLVIPKQVQTEHKIVYHADKFWLESVYALLNTKLSVSIGSLVESSRIIVNHGEKRSIHDQTGAVALDMESAAVFAAGHAAGLPCLALRAIVDPVALDLPQAIVLSQNAEGQVDIKKLLLHLCCHPQQIPGLIKLGRNFKAAAVSLKIVAEQLNRIVDQINPVYKNG